MKKSAFKFGIILALLVVGIWSCQKDQVEVTDTAPHLKTSTQNQLDWDGRGTDSERCGLAGKDRPEEGGWIHWVFNTKGSMTNVKLKLGGTGSGVYEPGAPLNAEIWHFYTPFFKLEGLTATIHFDGVAGGGGGLVISDYCPGKEVEYLFVTKTVVTSFIREHFWDIDKKVKTENKKTLEDGTPKIWLYIDGSGDEKATWTVDVAYKGYQDRGHNVSGVISIVNTGKLDAVITNIVDKLAGTPITLYSDANCLNVFSVGGGVNLAIGQSLILYYSVDVTEKIEGDNIVTVTSQKNTYCAKEEIVWGNPTVEINKTVNVKDISDLSGEVNLGTVTAPNGDTFTYDKEFIWANYGANKCGSFKYDNVAKIVETKQYAEATLKVNVQCYVYESAWAKADANFIEFCGIFNNWGWTNMLSGPGTYNLKLWAAAGQCDTSKGTLVGSVDVVYQGGKVKVTFNLKEPYSLKDPKVYAGLTEFPMIRNKATVAPGQYYIEKNLEGEIYVIVHGVIGMPDPSFGK
jgi:hypothetical protein